MCIRDRLYTKQEWFKTREEMNEVFADVPEALSNTLEILDKVGADNKALTEELLEKSYNVIKGGLPG